MKTNAELAAAEAVPLTVLPPPGGEAAGGSLVFAHLLASPGSPPESPQTLLTQTHPRIGERLLKATLLLEAVAVHCRWCQQNPWSCSLVLSR